MIAAYFSVPLEVLVGQDELTALYLKELQQVSQFKTCV